MNSIIKKVCSLVCK